MLFSYLLPSLQKFELFLDGEKMVVSVLSTIKGEQSKNLYTKVNTVKLYYNNSIETKMNLFLSYHTYIRQNSLIFFTHFTT